MKIAFLKLCCPGDLLFTTPAVRAVKSRNPESSLFYITGQYSSFVPEHNPHIDRTIIINPPYETGGWARALAGIYLGIRRISDEGFDKVICFHRSSMVASLGQFGRAAEVIGFDTALPMVDRNINFESTKHEVLRYLDLVSLTGSSVAGNELEYRTTPDEDEQAESLLKKSGISGQFAVVAPGGGENPGTIMHIKRWPVARYKSVAEHIRNRYSLPVVAAGSKSERDLAELAGPDLNLAGETTLPILGAILKRASIVIANDSGPLYLASAVGARTVGVYGPSSDDLVAPLVDSHRSVKNRVWCQPCYHPDNVKRGIFRCPSGTWACMLALDADRVTGAIDELLG